MASRLSVIIPTYNRCDLLRECLASLKAQTFTDFETIVVDDGSEEDVRGAVSAELAEARVLRLEKNGGFARAVNAGIAEAKTKHVMLLNDDMTLDPQCLAKLMHVADKRWVPMVAPLVYFKDDPEMVFSAGDRMRVNGRPESVGYRSAKEGFDAPKVVFGVSAGAAIFDRDVFDAVGPMDESFTAYFEDADLCFRARLAGYGAECAEAAVAYHVGSASLEGRRWWRSRQCFRNHALLFWRNMPWWLLVKFFPRYVAERIHQARSLVSAARAEFGLARALFELVRAELEVIASMPWTVRARWRNRRRRTIPTGALEDLMTR